MLPYFAVRGMLHVQHVLAAVIEGGNTRNQQTGGAHSLVASDVLRTDIK